MVHPLVDDPSYETVHARLFYRHGRANKYTCPCGKQAYEWAYDHSDPNEKVDERGRPYSTDLDRYTALCRKCHRARDAKDSCRKGHPFTAENTYTQGSRRFCRTCRRDYMRQRRSSQDG